MNAVFWFIVIVVLVLIWFCLSFAFKALGRFAFRLYKDAKDEIVGENEQKEKENNNG